MFICSQCSNKIKEKDRVYVGVNWCRTCVHNENQRNILQDSVSPNSLFRTRPPKYVLNEIELKQYYPSINYNFTTISSNMLGISINNLQKDDIKIFHEKLKNILKTYKTDIKNITGSKHKQEITYELSNDLEEEIEEIIEKLKIS